MTLFRKNLFAISIALTFVSTQAGYGFEPAVAGARRAARAERLLAQLSQQATPAPRACPAGAKLFAVPVLVPGQPAWVTVQDKDGRPLPNVSVFCNEQQHFTDANGRLAFDVPNGSTVNLHLIAADGKEFQNSRYVSANDGLLCRVGTERLVQDCMNSAPRSRANPTILYAPAVVTPEALETVLGTGFSGRPDAECLIIDGRESETLSASKSAILSKVPSKVAVGPIKQVYVSTKGGESSNIIEEDVARAELRFENGSPTRLAAVGTNLPVLAAVDLAPGRAASDDRSPDLSIITLPGGDNNVVTLQAQQMGRDATMSGSLVPTDPELTSSMPPKIDTELKESVTQARLIKLQRRLLAIQNRITEARKHREGGPASADEEEKATSELRALAVRQSALETAVTAHKAVLVALGCSNQQIQQCLDDAAGGAFYVVEKSVKDVILVNGLTSPMNLTRVAQSNSQPAFMPPPPPRHDPLSEPKIMMWAPPEGVVALGLPILQAPLPSKGVVDKSSTNSPEKQPPVDSKNASAVKGADKAHDAKSEKSSSDDKHKPAEKSSLKQMPKSKKGEQNHRKNKSKSTAGVRKHHRRRH